MWNIEESDFDTTYLAQWEITQLDHRLSQKAGTVSIHAVVRSVVNKNEGTITLYSFVPGCSKNSRDFIIMNGSVGLSGKIGEKSKLSSGTGRVNTIYLHSLSQEFIQHNQIKVGKDKYQLSGTCEFDDVVYNAHDDYTFPVTYYIRGRKKILHGLSIVIPIDKFNNYVRMKNLWYIDYDGAKEISPHE